MQALDNINHYKIKMVDLIRVDCINETRLSSAQPLLLLHTVCLSMLKCKGQIKSSYSRKPMVVSCQLGQVGWRSTLGTSTFGLLCLFNGHKLPENAIKRPFMAISGSGGSKWLDFSGSWLDLGGIHPGWSVGAIWTHQNCHRGPWGGSGMAQKCHKSGISCHKWP